MQTKSAEVSSFTHPLYSLPFSVGADRAGAPGRWFPWRCGARVERTPCEVVVVVAR